VTTPARAPARPSRRRRLGVLSALTLAASLVLGLAPAPAAAATATPAQLGSIVLKALNADRIARGLVPLRAWTALTSLATDRAQRMASKNTLSHTAAGGNVGNALTARGIQWYSYGEIIGMSGRTWGSESANHIYSMWKNSSFHRSLMFSTRYNYVGVGFAYRSSNNTTWASVVFTESRDHTRPYAQMLNIRTEGTTVAVSWKGWDVRLQTHTAGLRSFDVQYRRDNGTWSTIRNDTTSTWLSLSGRAHGHWYGFRVQSADRRGNLSLWTSELRIWLP
jgi:uncharacterized protein YkwD